MNARIEVLKTYKLFINGAFVRSESGRSHVVPGGAGEVVAHVSKASRKDLRDAVEAARTAQGKWAGASAYNRGQILYRMAEMIEGKRGEFVEAIRASEESSRAGRAKKPASSAKRAPAKPEDEVARTIDRLIYFAGWSDKFAQVLGCHNPVSGPFYNFTVPEATGVVGVVAPDESPLLALVSLFAPALVCGNSVVALASTRNPIPAAILGEVCATGDVPPGVLNILTGDRAELLVHVASHRDIDAIHAGNLSADQASMLRAGSAENLKRVLVRTGVTWHDDAECQTPWWIEPFVEMKTIWHPASA